MADVIYKYPLSGAPSVIALPALAQIVSVQMQHDVPTLWVQMPGAERDDGRMRKRVFDIYMTGQPMRSEPGTHRATLFSGPIVLHVYEREG